MKIDVGKCSRVGPRHTDNEDAVGHNLDDSMMVIEDALPIFAAADGVGGQAGGDVASRKAINTLLSHFNVEDGDPADELIDAVNAANQTVIEQQKEELELANMGTTIVACSVTEQAAYIANVGDSRAYLVGESGGVDQITIDHSLVSEMQRRGIEVGPNARRNIITRALGKNAELNVDLFYVSWGPGQSVVLCSDGVWDVLDESRIGKIVAEHDAQEAAEAIVQAVEDAGPTDDMAVVVCKRLA